MQGKHRGRSTLKSYFRKGAIPTEEHFAELIDSAANLSEDGLVKIAADGGLRLFSPGRDGVFASVCADNPERSGAAPLWRFVLCEDGALEIRNGKDEPVLRLGQDYAENAPEGTGVLKIKADGRWHDLPVEAAIQRHIEGCRVYHLSACYRNLKTGACVVCQVTASHSGARKCKVRGGSGRIRVRWQRHEGKLYLRMKCRGAQSGPEAVHCRIETLWNL
jgi:hypothetical protein